VSESETSASGRRDFLQTVLAAPVLAAALVDTAQAEPAQRDVFVTHAYEEHTVNLGEVEMNYVVSGRATSPALLLIPGQTESWWGFEKAIALLEKEFQVFAVDLRGQGRTTWTPRRYTLDNMGNDLVRFIALVITRPVITSGCSSGGVLSAWLSAFAMPGQVRGSHYEDPPLFASEYNPLYGHSVRQTAVGPSFEAFAKFLGDQWSIGDWKGMVASAATTARPNAGAQTRGAPAGGALQGPPQNLKEYDPEWARAFIEGTVALSCPHERMLAQVKVPVLFTHHSRAIDPATGRLVGAISDLQAGKVKELVTAAGQSFEYVSLPDAAHAMHQADPARFAQVLTAWAKNLPA
jgi:pimeloyl-ACP methyl ester carboxylesterase